MNDFSAGDGSGLVDLIASFLGSGIDHPSSPSELVREPSNSPADSLEAESNIVGHDSQLNPPVRVVVFSKDRPWQLQQLLLTMKLPFPNGQHYSDRGSMLRVDIFVIVHSSSEEFSRGYKSVMHSTASRDDNSIRERWQVHFLFEQGGDDANQNTNPDNEQSNSFSRILKHVLTHDDENSCHNHDIPGSLPLNTGESNQGVIMFLTDDCLLLEPLEAILLCAIGSLSYHDTHSPSSGSVFNFIARLHPGISWSQTRGVSSPPPRNQFKFYSLSSCDGVYLYSREFASVEWNYPFDLSGGVYCRSDILSLLKTIEDNDGLSSPNVFELRCNEALKKHFSSTNLHLDSSRKSLTAIPTRPFVIILAVNRVQEVFKVPLASPSITATVIGNGHRIDPSNTYDLLKLLDNKTNLDLERYKTTLYNTSHIGEFFLSCPSCHQSSIDSMNADPPDQTVSSETIIGHVLLSPKLSVLIPVNRGPPESAAHAIISIILQPFEKVNNSYILNANSASALLPMQIVLVDDRCKDGSIQTMVTTAENLVSLLKISMRVRDFRTNTQTHSCGQLLDGEVSAITVDIIPTLRPGVAAALNHGLKYCQSDLVARMDADDIAAQNRLLTQLLFMRANPKFDVVGTSALIFSAQTNGDNKEMFSSTLPYCDACLEVGVNSVQKCNVIGTSLLVSDPGFLSWSMLFSCSIPHPSVLFRKSAVEKNSCYDENITCCEDYDLWLRITRNNCRSITSIPILGLWHRKHGQSQSIMESANQKNEADLSSYKAMKLLLETSGRENDLSLKSVSTLRNPSRAQSPRDVDAAALLLQNVESAFIELHSQCLTLEEIRLVHLDVNFRMAELAEKFLNESIAWKLWGERCPNQQLERLSLLCHSNLRKRTN
ncbi:hypothetical protein ACHAW6_015256, partial [Cyclotella cf. meneghiniana]